MPPPVTEQPPIIVPPAPCAPPAPQVQVPSSIPPPPAPPQRTYPFSIVHPPVTFVPETRIQDLTIKDVGTQTQNARVSRERRPKVWTNWELGAREKLRSRGPQDLTMMEIQSLINPTVWNWLWDHKDAVHHQKCPRALYARQAYNAKSQNHAIWAELVSLSAS